MSPRKKRKVPSLPDASVTVPEMPKIDPPIPAFAPEGVDHAVGDIMDPPRVLRLAYLQTLVEKLEEQLARYRLAFDDQIRNIQTQRNGALNQIAQDLATARRALQAHHEEIEQAHKIQLSQYAFDPDTGAFNKVGGSSAAESKGASEAAPPPAQ